jgi:hypothetical protein
MVPPLDAAAFSAKQPVVVSANQHLPIGWQVAARFTRIDGGRGPARALLLFVRVSVD